jgi:hypothetical protein
MLINGKGKKAIFNLETDVIYISCTINIRRDQRYGGISGPSFSHLFLLFSYGSY